MVSNIIVIVCSILMVGAIVWAIFLQSSKDDDDKKGE